MLLEILDPTHKIIALLVLGIIEYFVEDRSADAQAMYKDNVRLLWVSHCLRVDYGTIGRSQELGLDLAGDSHDILKWMHWVRRLEEQ